MKYAIIIAIIGVMLFGAGVYYLIKEKNDVESKKIYSIVTTVGAVVIIASAIYIFTHI